MTTDAGDEQHAHRGEDRPALTLVAHHAAEHVGHRCAEREDREHLNEVRQRGRVLERMRGVGVEEAAAVGAEHLDRDLRGDRADRDGLLGAFERGRLDVRSERLRDALPDEEQREDDADRQQHVERAARDIDPEIADRLGGGAREAADQRDGEHDAGRRRQEVLVRQAEHLHEIGHRAFAAVVLPVGVGDEADRRVERRDRARRRTGPAGLNGSTACRRMKRVEKDEAADVKQQHRDRVGQPMLLARLVDASQPDKAAASTGRSTGERNVRSPLNTRVMYAAERRVSATMIAQKMSDL